MPSDPYYKSQHWKRSIACRLAMDRHRCVGARLRPAREALGVGVVKTLELRARTGVLGSNFFARNS